MLYRRFGRTELKMPVFSCGGMRYQHSWQDVPLSKIPQKNQDNLEATIRRSIELGINHIETARGYGTSEIQPGQVLPTFDCSELIIQTKVSPKADPKEFEEIILTSLANLQLDYIDLLGLHGINNAQTLHNSIRPGGCVAVAKKLPAQGKIRHIGFSTHGPTQVIVDAIESNATCGGAKVLGREDIGHLAPGMSADFIAYDVDTPALVGSHHDIVAALIFCQPAVVDYSFINGKKIVDQSRLTAVDLDSLIKRCNQLAAMYS